METLHITLFGSVKVVHPSVATQPRLARSTQALLAYLLLQPRLVPRDVLMDVFWVETPPDRARSSLTTAIWRLRQVLEPDDVPQGTYLVTSSTGEVGFNWESVHWVDVRIFEQRVYPLLRVPVAGLADHDLQTIAEVLALYRGDLLEGVYEDWALRERERFRALYLNCLTRLMECHAVRRDFERSIAYGQEILRRDPLREEIHRALMRLYLENGQRTLAMRQYERCRDLLRQELEMPPLEETQALYREIVPASRLDSPVNGQSPAQEITHLLGELQAVKRSLDDTTRALERITQSVNRLVKTDNDGAVIAGSQT